MPVTRRIQVKELYEGLPDVQLSTKSMEAWEFGGRRLVYIWGRIRQSDVMAIFIDTVDKIVYWTDSKRKCVRLAAIVLGETIDCHLQIPSIECERLCALESFKVISIQEDTVHTVTAEKPTAVELRPEPEPEIDTLHLQPGKDPLHAEVHDTVIAEPLPDTPPHNVADRDDPALDCGVFASPCPFPEEDAVARWTFCDNDDVTSTAWISSPPYTFSPGLMLSVEELAWLPPVAKSFDF
jgi:hypothetical protein